RRSLTSAMAPPGASPCPAYEPRPVQGDVSHRVLPPGRVRRSCRAMRGLPPPPHRLQLLPQPPPAFASLRRGRLLPQVPGQRQRTGLPRARPTCSRSAISIWSSPCRPIAYQNKAVVYDLLFRTASETLLTIAADPKH